MVKEGKVLQFPILATPGVQGFLTVGIYIDDETWEANIEFLQKKIMEKGPLKPSLLFSLTFKLVTLPLSSQALLCISHCFITARAGERRTRDQGIKYCSEYSKYYAYMNYLVHCNIHMCSKIFPLLYVYPCRGAVILLQQEAGFFELS